MGHLTTLRGHRAMVAQPGRCPARPWHKMDVSDLPDSSMLLIRSGTSCQRDEVPLTPLALTGGVSKTPRSVSVQASDVKSRQDTTGHNGKKPAAYSRSAAQPSQARPPGYEKSGISRFSLRHFQYTYGERGTDFH
jgi:hypothetical protein